MATCPGRSVVWVPGRYNNFVYATPPRSATCWRRSVGPQPMGCCVWHQHPPPHPPPPGRYALGHTVVTRSLPGLRQNAPAAAGGRCGPACAHRAGWRAPPAHRARNRARPAGPISVSATALAPTSREPEDYPSSVTGWHPSYQLTPRFRPPGAPRSLGTTSGSRRKLPDLSGCVAETPPPGW